MSTTPITDAAKYEIKYLNDQKKVVVDFDEMERLEKKYNTLRGALDTIAGGRVTNFPGAPKLLGITTSMFQRDMWLWSQKVAHAALDAPAHSFGPDDRSDHDQRAEQTE